MERLALRIPPPVYAGLFALAMCLLSLVTPAVPVPTVIRIVLAAALAIVAIAVVASAIASFARAGTTINPHAPERTSTVIVTGVYRITRNPMYLAMLLALLALGAGLANPVSLVVALCFIPLITRVQIIPEERVLAARFGTPYLEYCRSVRRWI